MRILKHLTANDVHLEPFPFKRELSMEAYLVENERVLQLDNDTFGSVEIVETELTLKQGRKSQDTDGRIDILATYSQEYIAVVELKIGQLQEADLIQLEDYLQQKHQILEQYPNILNKELVPIPKWVGVLVGSTIETGLAEKLRQGYKTASGVQVAALAIQRFRSTDGNIYVTTDIFFSGASRSRDTTQYLFNNSEFGKGRLVLAVIKRHVESHPKATFAELEKNFPQSCQGSIGVFSTVEKANEILAETGRKRHYLGPDELVQLSDCTIAVCSQWGISNIDLFIQQASKNGCVIKRTSG